MAYFDATRTFDEALSEIDILAEQAANSSKYRLAYLANVKAAFVLLGAKFEAFAENIVEDYVDKLAHLGPKGKHLPTELRLHSTTHLLAMCIKNSMFSEKSDAVENLKIAASLWVDEHVHSQFSISSKFNYGKHGSEELINLFKRIGITNVVSECQVTSNPVASVFSITAQRMSIKASLDSLTHIRNNIIHSDASPTNITHQQLLELKEVLWEFGYVVDMRLNTELLKIVALKTASP